MFSARNLDLSEVSLNTSRELEAYIIIKTWIHEIYYRPLRYLWRKRVSSPTHWQWWVIDTDIQPGFTPVNWNADSSEYPIETWDVDKKVWEEYGFSGSSISLNVAVSEIRKAFKLLGRETAPIKTLAKVGFCFYRHDWYLSITADNRERNAALFHIRAAFASPPVAGAHITSPQKKAKISAITAICGVFIPLLFVATFYPIEPPDQPREKLVPLGKKTTAPCILWMRTSILMTTSKKHG